MINPLRVMHLGKYYPPAPGGIESLVRDLAVTQAAQGLDVSVHVFHHDTRIRQTAVEDDNGVEVVRHSRRAGFAKLDYASDLIDQIRATRAEIVHLHVPNPSMILALLNAPHVMKNVPIVVTYHSDVIRQRLRAALFRPLERRLFRHVDAICPTSPMYANGSRFLKPYRSLIRPVPMGLRLDKYLAPSDTDLQMADQLRRQAQGPIWLGCGRLVYYKGFQTAIEALGLTRSGGELWLIGTGPDKARLQAAANRNGLGDRVKFLGHVPSTVPYYHAADAFWFPSNARSEAFGLAQVEAMASGCPVINTYIPDSGVAWVSQHGLTGLTVPVGDAQALALAADQLATDANLRSTLAQSARRRARDQFEIDVMARRHNRIYQDVLGRTLTESEPDYVETVGTAHPAASGAA
jgi:rhamnosyl/mannosyltransferase